MANILICGEAWGEAEAAERKPFVGPTGRELNRLCEDAGLLPEGAANEIYKSAWRRDELYYNAGIFLTNVFNFRPPNNKIEAICVRRELVGHKLPAIKAGLYIRDEYLGELERLAAEIEQQRPNIIVAMGNVACWALLGSTAITKLRGAVAMGKYGKTLPTFHPAYLFRGAWDQRSDVVFDLAKAKRESAYPEIRRPKRHIVVPESVIDFVHLNNSMRDYDGIISIDIETAGELITCIGFAYGTEYAIVIPFVDRRNENASYWREPQMEYVAWNFVRRQCLRSNPKVLQNGLYDLHFMWRTAGITVTNCLHDTMLLQHALQPEMRKGLGYLGSIWTDEVSWKLMRARAKEATIKRED